MGWLSGWGYRHAIAIPAVSVEQTNINIVVQIAYDSLMQSGFDDIRFTDSDGTTELYCFKDSFTASASAIYLTKIPVIPVAGKSIYMYFGNASAADPSDGENTFLFFDDFSGDLSKWTVDAGADTDISDGVLAFWGHLGDTTKVIKTPGTYGIHTFARAKMRFVFGGSTWRIFNFGLPLFNFYSYIASATGVGQWDNYTQGAVAPNLDDNWHYVDLWRIKSNLVRHYFDNVLDFTQTAVTHADAHTIGFTLQIGSNSAPLYVDHVYVGQCPADETEFGYLTPDPILESNLEADFGVDRKTGCNPLTVQFTDRSIGTPVSWLWNFGDGETSTLQNPSHIYRAKGTYDITFTVTDGAGSSSVTATGIIQSKCVMLQCYLNEVRGQTDSVEEISNLPFGLLRDWVHKDICDTAYRLFPVIGSYYRELATVAVSSGVGIVVSGVDHIAASASLTGFSGLTVDGYANGSVIHVDGTTIYHGRIISNTATVITLESGSSLPAVTDGVVLITINNSGTYASLSGVDMMWYEEPFWCVMDGSGKTIDKLPLDFAEIVDEITQYAGKVYFYVKGQEIHLALGDGSTLPGHLQIGIYRKPRKAESLTDCIDLPVEYHNVAQLLTMARIRDVQKKHDESAELRIMFEKSVEDILQSSETMRIEQLFLEEIKK